MPLRRQLPGRFRVRRMRQFDHARHRPFVGPELGPVPLRRQPGPDRLPGVLDRAHADHIAGQHAARNVNTVLERLPVDEIRWPAVDPPDHDPVRVDNIELEDPAVGGVPGQKVGVAVEQQRPDDLTEPFDPAQPGRRAIYPYRPNLRTFGVDRQGRDFVGDERRRPVDGQQSRCVLLVDRDARVGVAGRVAGPHSPTLVVGCGPRRRADVSLE